MKRNHVSRLSPNGGRNHEKRHNLRLIKGGKRLAGAPRDARFNYHQAFCRNIGLVTDLEQERLRESTIAIPGMGGVGGIHLLNLARMGVGGFHIADSDNFTLANFNRQYGATVQSLAKSKVEVMEQQARMINPELRLQAWKDSIGEENVEEFLSGCDLVVDGVDAYATETRRIIFMTAAEMGIPVITAGPIGFSAALLVFTPDSMTYEEYFDYSSETAPNDQFVKFILGLTPRPLYLSYLNVKKVDANQRNGPSMASSVALCAGFAGVEALKLLLDRGKVYPVPYYHYFDPYLMKFKVGWMPLGNRNPWQKLKFFVMKKFILKL